jgi:RND family efflux transporter MFP subunit
LLVFLPLIAAVHLACGGVETPGREKPRAVPVETEVVRLGPFQPSLVLLGIVRPAETVPLVTSYAGRVRYPERFPAGLRTGERVEAGETLARVENESVSLALAEARLLADSKRAELERFQRAYKEGLIPESDLAKYEIEARLAKEKLQSAQRDAGRLALKTPRDGTLVVESPVAPQVEVSAGTVLAEIAGEGAPRVEAWAAAADRTRVRPGLRVRFRAPGVKKEVGEGVIREVAAVVDAAGTVRVVADVLDAEGLPVAGEGVEVLVELDRRPDAVTVPEEALVIGSGGSALFVLQGSAWGATQVRRVPVVTEGRGGGRVEIRSGLKVGDHVVVTGVAFLADGVTVSETVMEPPAAPDSPAAAGESEEGE